MNHQWNLPQVPRDEDGFTRSFSKDQVDDYLKFFEEFGFVVISNVLNKEEVQKSVEEIWNELEGISIENFVKEGETLYMRGYQLEIAGYPMQAVNYYMKAYALYPDLESDEVSQQVIKKYKHVLQVDRNDPNTWKDTHWPQPQTVGFLGHDVAAGCAAWENRQNANVYSVFSNLMERRDLWTSVDRYGIMRPTRDVPQEKLHLQRARTTVELGEEDKGIKVQDMLEWKTMEAWTHWDLNPWLWYNLSEEVEAREYEFTDFISENNLSKNTGALKLQGLITFADSRDNDGGFCTVPGFHKHLKEWAIQNKDLAPKRGNASYVRIPKKDPIHQYLEKITARAGSLIVWRSEQPHCNFPNDSNRFRMNQYLKMFPAQEGKPRTDLRKKELLRMLPPDLAVTSLGKKLFGLSSWYS